MREIPRIVASSTAPDIDDFLWAVKDAEDGRIDNGPLVLGRSGVKMMHRSCQDHRQMEERLGFGPPLSWRWRRQDTAVATHTCTTFKLHGPSARPTVWQLDMVTTKKAAASIKKYGCYFPPPLQHFVLLHTATACNIRNFRFGGKMRNDGKWSSCVIADTSVFTRITAYTWRDAP